MAPHQHPSSGFTSHLLETLQASRLELDAHVEREKQNVDAQIAAYQERLQHEEASLQAQQQTLEEVRAERGVSSDDDVSDADDNAAGIAKRRHELTVQQSELQEQIQTLEEEKEKQSDALEELQEEELAQRSKAEEARQHKERVEESKKTTVDDLTRGIINYKYLGFDFVKAPNKGNGLCFTFRQLDAGDPHRVFSFVLTANEEDAYVVEDCDELKEETLEPLLQKLNKSDDLSAFMIGMRRAFSETV